MMRPATLAATKRCWLARLGAASLALATSGCEVPAHAALLQCSGTSVSYVDMRHDCKVTIEKFERQNSTSIKIDTSRRLAFVKGHFTVQQGSARIVFKGSAGSNTEVLVSPDKPGTMEGMLNLNLQNNGFNLHFYPKGEVAGLEGQVSYEPR